jgi:hypothetical protein
MVPLGTLIENETVQQSIPINSLPACLRLFQHDKGFNRQEKEKKEELRKINGRAYPNQPLLNFDLY